MGERHLDVGPADVQDVADLEIDRGLAAVLEQHHDLAAGAGEHLQHLVVELDPAADRGSPRRLLRWTTRDAGRVARE